ncbi:unnamed protein product [Arabidopsis halleri]
MVLFCLFVLLHFVSSGVNLRIGPFFVVTCHCIWVCLKDPPEVVYSSRL